MSRLSTLTDRKMAISLSEEKEYSFDTCIRVALPLYSDENCLWQLMGNDCGTCLLEYRDVFEEHTEVLDVQIDYAISQ